MSFFYLATPYSNYPGGREAAYAQALATTARFFRAGIPVYSPIVATHPAAQRADMVSVTHQDWMELDYPMMDAALAVVVVMLPGWKESKGVQMEIDRCKATGQQVYYFMPGDPILPIWKNRLAAARSVEEKSEWTAGLVVDARKQSDPAAFDVCGPQFPPLKATKDIAKDLRKGAGIPENTWLEPMVAREIDILKRRLDGEILESYGFKPDYARSVNPAPITAQEGEELRGLMTEKIVNPPVVEHFATGANRSASENKPDYEGFLSPLVIEAYGAYMHHNRRLPDGTMRNSDNWQKGIPLVNYMKSGWRHMLDWWKEHRGLTTSEGIVFALCGVIFNASGYLHEYLKVRSTALDEALKRNAKEK